VSYSSQLSTVFPSSIREPTCKAMKSTNLIYNILLTFLLSSSTQATWDDFDYSNEISPPGGKGNASLTQTVIHPLKFEEWYDDFKADLVSISTGVCNLSLAAYRGDAAARQTLGPVSDYCWTHADCILSTTPAHVTASFAGTSILLGLGPTTLSVLGPSVAEMALLSLHRPFLSFLLSLGAPAVFPGRFLLWDDPLRANEPSVGAFVIRPFSTKWAIVVSILEYVIGAAACGNIFHATYKIGIKSIVSWSCRVSFWPLLWVVVSLVIHLTATVSLRVAIKRKTYGPEYDAGSWDGRDRPKATGLKAFFVNELLPSANSTWKVHDLYDVEIGQLAVGLQYTGAFISVCHLLFGTLLFSSLQFIGVREALMLILRLIGSAVFCRILLQVEVGGMIKVDEKRLYRSIVQASDEEKA
jgi:hypothetical protein